MSLGDEQEHSRQLDDGGEMAALVRDHDWSRTPLGPREAWPRSLRTAVSLCLAARAPMSVMWGPEHILLYNDGYRPMLGEKHPGALGRPSLEVWSEAEAVMHPNLKQVYGGGAATWDVDHFFALERRGRPEETYFTFGMSPIEDESGGVGGVCGIVTETSARVLGERRLKILRALAERSSNATTVSAACEGISGVLEEAAADMPFALLYLEDEKGAAARLRLTVGIEPGTPASPERVLVDDAACPWPARRVLAKREEVLEQGLSGRLGELPGRPWPEPAEQALVLPVALSRDASPLGFLVAGLSPRLFVDEAYRGFLQMAANQIATALTSARSQEEQNRWTEAERARLYGLFMQAPAPIIVTRGPEHRFELVNPPAATLHQGKDLIGKTYLEAFPEHAGSSFVALRDRVYATGEAYVGQEAPARQWWGDRGAVEERHFSFVYQPLRDEGGEVTGIMSLAFEVSEQVSARRRVEKLAEKLHSELEQRAKGEEALERSQQALSESEARLRFAITAARLGTWDLDLKTKGAARSLQHDQIFGYDTLLPEWTYEMFIEHVLPEDRGLVDEAFRAATDAGSDWRVQARIRRTDGEVRWISVAGTHLRDRDGVAVRMLGAVADVTEQKEAELALRDESRRKDEFLAMLAHELRNPLAPIRTSLELLRRRQGGRLERELAVVSRQADHLSRLVDDLLDVSRITRGRIELRREPVDMRSVVSRAVDAVRDLIEGRRHEVAISLPARPLLVLADPFRLDQVVMNLLTNAAKYTEPGGRIGVVVERAGGEVELRVEDNGVGIAAEMLPRIFNIFEQEAPGLDRSKGGLGIGLTIVRTLVQMHGGHVEAKSAGSGQGSTFVVRLPISEVPMAKPPVPSSPARAHPSRPTRRVLVVDDNVDAAEMLAEILAGEGEEVFIAHDGESALELAARHEPHVVLLDIGLPGMDGFQVAERLRAGILPRARLVALTGYSQAADRQRALEAGFDHHLVKPASIEALLELLEAPPTSNGGAREPAEPEESEERSEVGQP